MSVRKTISLSVLLILLLALACAKLEEPRQEPGGAIQIVDLPFKDAIPEAWGDLEAVTTSADFGHIFQLWFEDEEGNIRMVGYNMRTNEFQEDGRIFPRR